jgi:starch synthase (maltosyl-transferring)
MGFDVLYFPPIHPIGTAFRKGPNNTLTPGPDDPGSPYAIGSPDGGHTAIHPQLGTIEDFRALRDAAHEHGLELALDFAIQCSQDHPWLKEHPEWFDWRPDGSIRYAENPPKKYQDIVNVDFYADGAVPSLWQALCDVVLFWANEGIRTFRVDNPHTKPFPFWEWMIARVRAKYPDALFLSEAFTRPKPMYRLAKVGFSQSYTYFTWRNSKQEFIDYLTELTTTPPKDFFRPNFFVNTPDIDPYFLQTSGRPGAGDDALRAVGHVLRLRDLRSGAHAWQGGVSRLREVRDTRPRFQRPGQHRRRDHPVERDPPRSSGPAESPERAFPAGEQPAGVVL